jgi:hypothetical protein
MNVLSFAFQENLFLLQFCDNTSDFENDSKKIKRI